MDPAIELRHLRYYLAVVEELHFGRAAARLGISQPPLSQTIRRLEDELGVQLLQRTSRSVVPTPAGLALAGEARRVLGALECAVAEARRAAGTRSVGEDRRDADHVARRIAAILDRPLRA